jgi:hypothetical protein
MTKMVEHLPSKCEVLISNPSTTKKKFTLDGTVILLHWRKRQKDAELRPVGSITLRSCLKKEFLNYLISSENKPPL